jgi:ATP-dependent exoDNAse (exonuclease V) beta subunit
MPERLLPHRLGGQGDQVRNARHESADAEPVFTGNEEAIAYGLWWHESVEHYPWEAEPSEQDAYVAERQAVAEAAGHGSRAQAEWARFEASSCWSDVADGRWQRQAELSVLAPLEDQGWVDGVIDLVLWDPQAGEWWIVDWKTNRQRSGESDEQLAVRLVEHYTPQLQAYGQCLAPRFEAQQTRLLLYSTALGNWLEIPQK